jgi:hypothetical protein
MKTIFKTLCALALVYTYMLASSWDADIEEKELRNWNRVVAEADQKQFEAFRRGK